MATVNVRVYGLSGPRCSVQAPAEWTILQVHEAIAEKMGIPVDWQTLVQGTEKLPWEAAVSGLLSSDLETLELTLLVEEAPEPEPEALYFAIRRRDGATALELLRRHKPPGLNGRRYESESTVLHEAIRNRLPDVALAILGRRDFAEINASDDYSVTALHEAAGRGSLPVCRAILAREDFTGLLAPLDADAGAQTALEVAREAGHREVEELLRAAEAQGREAGR